MSIPINHHYVSQCQIKNFFNKELNTIYLYDKERNNFYSKESSKYIFSENELNSKLLNKKTVDHITIENDIKLNFEDKFRTHTNIILEGLNSNSIGLEFKKSLDEIAKLAIIGEFRTPTYKQNTEEIITNIFNEIKTNSNPELKKSIEQIFKCKEKTKYLNALTYSEIANSIFYKMGTVNHKIIWIQSEDYFILPDCSSIVMRAKINEYFNPDIKEIAQVGMPLTSKIFVFTSSNKLKQCEDSLMIIEKDSNDYIFNINRTLINNSTKTIACENKNYLEYFVNRCKNTLY